jgi:hypothetical protein
MIDDPARAGAGTDREAARDRAHDRRTHGAAERHRQEQAEQQAAGQDRDRWCEDQLGRAPGRCFIGPIALALVAAPSIGERVASASRRRAAAALHDRLGEALITNACSHPNSLGALRDGSKQQRLCCRPTCARLPIGTVGTDKGQATP